LSDPQSRLFEALTDRYLIERELGAGGMATVYLAQDLKHDRKVAIKVLRPELAAVIGAERFLREIKTIANLQHPHILGLIDSGEVNGTAYYVMPFVEGESLRDRLTRQKQLAVTEAVRIAIEVAGALDYAHRHGVIHRDIKPENILLHDDRALVSDFGIALAVSSAGGTRMTETGMSLGTPHYMSPEQAMGEREISARSDVYALGCTLYEMLTGDPPFTGSTAQAIVAKVLTEAPRGLTAQRHTIPPQVEAAVLTALEKLPADRFASAKEFAEALEGKTVQAYEGRRSAPARSAPLRSYRPAVPTAIAGVLLGALALWGWLRHPQAAGVSRQQVVLWQHPFGRFLAPGLDFNASQAAIAPDGSSIVFADSTGGGLQLFKKLRTERRPVPLAGTERGVSPFFSPDGKWIGYVTTDGRLRKVPVDGGGSITLASDGNLTYPTAAWLDDGTIVYAGIEQVRRIPSEGGASRPVRAKPAREAFNTAQISPLPGSRGFFYSNCPGNCAVESSIYVFDFAADSGRLLVPHAAGAWYSPTGHLLYTDREGGLYAARFDPGKLALKTGVVPILEDVAPASFALSASGSALYSMKGGGNTATDLMWVSRDGATAPFDSTWHADFEYPALSPDGKALAVSVREGSTQLWIRRSNGTRQKLTQSGTVNWRPSWTPDGRSVAFVSNLKGGGGQEDYDIYQMPVDGSAPASLLQHYTFGLWEAEFSRDGQWLVMRSDEHGSSNIRGHRLHGDSALVPLVIDKGTSLQAAVSPDGQWLACTSDATGRSEVYVTPFPNATSTLLVSQGGGTEPRWAHSGRELFFKGGTHLMAVAVAPGPTFVAGTPHPLFPLAGYRAARNRQQYDVAPDDRHFVMIREPRDEAGAVVYVDNWFAELEAKVKAKH